MRAVSAERAVKRAADAPPEGAASSSVLVRVPFFDTDAMGIVHHANYVRYLELARVRLLEEHQRPYTEWLARDLHFAVTRVEVDYLRAARFDERLQVCAWLTWVRGASLGLGYVIRCSDETVVCAVTEHAMVDGQGRPRRIPRELRAEMEALLATGAQPAAPRVRGA